MKNNIGLKIRQLRELRGFSQEYMASKLSLSQRQYSKIERNEAKIDWNKINNNSTSEKLNYPKKLIEQYEKIIEQYERRLKQLEEENSFFKSIFIKNKKHK